LYSSITDRVTIPPRNLFISAGEYGATLLHERTHSTGHKSRLARESITEAAEFGFAIYSKEELIAEIRSRRNR
jgi:antirestriction protein ArdC